MSVPRWYLQDVERDALDLATQWSVARVPGHHPGVRIRWAERHDIAAIRDVLRDANAEFADAMGPTLFAGYMANVLDVESRMLAGRVLVATSEHTILGSVSWYREASDEGMGAFPAGTAGLRAMAVAPVARGRGVGHRLVGACLEEARRARARAMVLHTAPYMEAARRIYEQVGFLRRPDLDFDSAPFFGGGPDDRLPAMGFLKELARP